MIPEAKIILDSIGPDGQRLTTMQVFFHRFILSEMNTHREWSRNSASSRAIPVQKQIDKILEFPALPLTYQYNQPGMQSVAEMSEKDSSRAEQLILELRDKVAETAKELSLLGPIGKNGKPVGLHKQWVNRYMEPFMWHTAVVSATKFDNFFIQRCSPLAQPEIQSISDSMKIAYDNSEPQKLEKFDWHTPYIKEDEYESLDLEERKKVSAARCARVSYLTQNGIRDISEDIKMYNRLVSADPPHWSPLEHVATPFIRGKHIPRGNFIDWNFSHKKGFYPQGWGQLRHNPTR